MAKRVLAQEKGRWGVFLIDSRWGNIPFSDKGQSNDGPERHGSVEKFEAAGFVEKT